MPNCFQLIGKSSAVAEKFYDIDNELCKHLGVEVSQTQYYRGWYDSIGMLVAMGRTWADIREVCAKDIEGDPGDPELGKIIDWLSENYNTKSWYEPT